MGGFIPIYMKNSQNAAFVVSIHYGNTNEVARINVRWKGNHEISDFNFDRFGEVLSSESETENTGWVAVRSSYRVNNSAQLAHLVQQSQTLTRVGV
jgi:hypothetical protein